LLDVATVSRALEGVNKEAVKQIRARWGGGIWMAVGAWGGELLLDADVNDTQGTP